MEQAVVYNKHQVYEIIKDYHWMIQVIKQAELDDTAFKGVAQYGLEAALPSGKGVVGRALETEVVRRSDRFKRLSEYSNKVNYINENRRKLTSEKEIEVLDYLLDGESMTRISKFMGVRTKQINKMRSDIVDRIVDN